MDIYELPDVATSMQTGDLLVLCREVSPGVWTTYQIDAINLNGQNLSNTDLTFTGNRIHDMNSNAMLFQNGGIGVDASGTALTSAISATHDSATDPAVVIENTGAGGALVVNDGFVKFIAGAAPTYADEAAAVTAGLATGTIYKTATGELRIKL